MSLLVRTFFGDDAAWQRLLAVIAEPTDDRFLPPNVDPVDDRRFDGATPDELARPRDGVDDHDLVYVADERALTTEGHPLLVLRVGDNDVPFRCRADFVGEVDDNLTLGNLDWRDFVDQIGASGVYGDAPPTGPSFVTPDREFEAPGIAATQRVHDALLAGRVDADRRRRITVERVVPGTRRKLFSRFLDPTGWLTPGGGGIRGEWFALSHGYHTDPDDFFTRIGRIVPRGFTIECQIVEARPPRFVLATWEWRRLPGGAYYGRGSGTPILPDPQPTIRFDLDNTDPEERWPCTRIRVTHDGVPADLADDLTTYWTWALENLDYSWDLSGERQKDGKARRGY